MANKTLHARVILRNDTPANWTSANPVLYLGEIGIEQVTGLIKVGDGSSAWNDLPYINNFGQINGSSSAAASTQQSVNALMAQGAAVIYDTTEDDDGENSGNDDTDNP